MVKHVNESHEKVTLTCPQCCEEVFFLNTHMKEHGKTSGNASDVSDLSASLNSGEKFCSLCEENFDNDFLCSPLRLISTALPKFPINTKVASYAGLFQAAATQIGWSLENWIFRVDYRI